MAATSTRSVPELLEGIRAVRARVAAHKRTIKHTRQELAAAAAELLELEAECKRRGLAVVNQQPGGVEETHGRQKSPRSHN